MNFGVLWLPNGEPTLISPSDDMWAAFHASAREAGRPVCVPLRMPIPARVESAFEDLAVTAVAIAAREPHPRYRDRAPPRVPTLADDESVRALLDWMAKVYL